MTAMTASPQLWADVSSYQGSPNWAQVKADGVHGAIAKVNEGSNLDSTFASDWQNIAAAGLRRGAYDFGWTANDPTTEANIFLNAIKNAGGWRADDILVLDIEVVHTPIPVGSVAQWVYVWCSTVQRETGIVPWVYSYESYIEGNLQDPRLAAWPLWYAHDAVNGGPPPAPSPWKSLIAWQFGQGTLAGISGLTDEDDVYLNVQRITTGSEHMARRPVSNDGDDCFFKGTDNLLYTFFLKDDNTQAGDPYPVSQSPVDGYIGSRWDAGQTTLTALARGTDGVLYQIAFHTSAGSWGSFSPLTSGGKAAVIASLVGPEGPAGTVSAHTHSVTATTSPSS